MFTELLDVMIIEPDNILIYRMRMNWRSFTDDDGQILMLLTDSVMAKICLMRLHSKVFFLMSSTDQNILSLYQRQIIAFGSLYDASLYMSTSNL